jgi:hypothetical protein
VPVATASVQAAVLWSPSQGRYVRTKLTLDALDSVSGGTAAFTLLMPGTAGMSLHAKGTDPAARDKLQAELASLTVKLQLQGVTIGQSRHQAGVGFMQLQPVSHVPLGVAS